MKKGWVDRCFGGVVLIGIGVIFLLQQMNIVDISIGSIISTYWPLILIYAGIKNILTLRNEGSSFLGGFILIAIGGYFQARALDWVILTPGDFFKFLVPGFLILAGLFVIFKPQRRHSISGKKMKSTIDPNVQPQEPSELPSLPNLSDLPNGESQSTLDKQFEEKFGMSFGSKKSLDSDEVEGFNNNEKGNSYDDRQRRHHSKENYGDGEKINKSTFIGDTHMGREYFELKPTNISQFIGDTVLDLTKAQIPYGKTKINISAFIGDIKIYVPDDMDLGFKINASSFIGDMTILSESKSGFISNISSTTPYFKEANKKIIINVSAFIGDIKVNTVT
ncbi:cell wall-active antibiotics response protein LiaF [Paenibacillus sp. FA6]|uniref:cell wall-active antibiotics response protein LiaF n=1 Tax=Paenibacillus sp. FA6 TaxID=3413029 RepID=UPI003F65A662